MTKMKTNRSSSPWGLKPILLVALFALALSACKKEEPMSMAAAELESDKPNPWEGFNNKGPDLEMTFSLAIADDNLSKLIVLMAYQREDGDTEVLLSDLLAVPLKAGGTVADYIAALSRGNSTAADLNDFAANWPSTIVAVRGNPVSWLQGSHTPPVKFVPYDFDESTRSTMATVAGSPVNLDCSQRFTEAVLVLMRSERYGHRGGGTASDQQNTGGRLAGPQIGASDVGGPSVLSAVCDPEPVACPAVEPTLNSFTATAQNGGVLLSYNVSDLPSNLCSWGRIHFTRLNPDGSYRNWWRFADDPNSFYDDTGDPNITYTYTARAYVAFFSEATGDWVTCPAAPNSISQTIAYPEAGALVESYQGSNQSSTSIRYDWNLPTGAFADKIRIRRTTSTGFVTIDDNIPATSTSYFYNNVPSQFRGQKVETQIQYKASGPWQGAFFDETYASFREPGEPLYFNGIRMNLSTYEFAENPLYGSPEIHLSALQANIGGGTNEIATKYLAMTGCFDPTPVYVTISSVPSWPFSMFYSSSTTYAIILEENNGLFYPTDSPEGYEILSSWNSDLFSSAITVTLLESDAGEVNPTTTTTTSTESVGVNAKIGVKKEKIEVASFGVTSDWEDATSTTVEYPTEALPVEADRIIYYHEPLMLVKGTALFSNRPILTNCSALAFHL